jgi:hypothetical protein
MRARIDAPATADGRDRLEAIVGDRNHPQACVARGRTRVATADGCGTSEIVRRSGLPRLALWRWHVRLMRAGVGGFVRDKIRKPARVPLGCAENMAAVALFGLIIALAARSQLKVEMP